MFIILAQLFSVDSTALGPFTCCCRRKQNNIFFPSRRELYIYQFNVDHLLLSSVDSRGNDIQALPLPHVFLHDVYMH